MASSLIGSLRVALGLDTAQFESGANKASQIAKTRAGEMESSFKGVKTAIEGLFAAFAIGALTEQIKKSLEYAGSIAEVAKTLGVTTKDLQTFRYAAGQSGVAQDQLEVGLRRLTTSMGKAQLGSEAQAKAFKAIGISVEDLKGKTTGDIFRMMSDGLSKVTDRSQRAAIEMALMGRSGSTLDNLLAPGSKRLNELADAAQRLGIVLSDEQIQGAEETAHKLEAVKEVLAAQIAGIVANNANAILSLSSALATLTGEIARFLGSNPQLALGIIGGLLGGRVGGLPGAAVGVIGGVVLGANVAQNQADSNSNLQFRVQQMRAAQKAYLDALNSPAVPGTIGGHLGGATKPSAQVEKDEFIRQIGLLRQATAAARAQANAPKPVGVDLPKIFAPKPPKAHKVRQPKDLNEDVSFQQEQAEREADLQILGLKQQLAGNAQQRLALAVQQIQLEKQIQDAEIDHKVAKAQQDFAEHKITKNTLDEVVKGQAILKAKADTEAALKLQALAEQQMARREQALVEAVDQRYKFSIEALQSADGLATTQEDHRRIQLEILDQEIEQKRLELEHTKQLAIRNGATDEQIANIQAQIDHLPTERAEGAAAINHSTMSPLEQWAAQVPKTAAAIKESLQSIEVEGIDGLADALSKVVEGTGNLKQAFHQLALSVLEDLLKMTIKMLLFKALSSAFGSAFGGSSDTPNVNTLGSDFHGFATGGGFTVLGNTGTDSNILSVNGLPIAKVSHGERIGIANDNFDGARQAGGASYHFDLRGAVMTEDILRQINEMGGQAAAAGAQMGVQQMADINQRTFGRSLGRRG